jgi:hydroxymethylglutaryl-CoA lyase
VTAPAATADAGVRLPPRIRLVEVGLRDGLQTVTTPVSTEDKLALVEALIASGVTEIEAVSFAHPRVLPQLADASEVMARVARPPGVTYRGLVPNLRGAQRAADCGLDVTVALACADETVTRRNQNATVAEVLAELPKIAEVVRGSGSEFVVGVANAFFAWGSGVVPQQERLRCVDAAVEAGARGVYLACTTGMEDPRQVFDGVREVRERHPGIEVGVHLHARNGMALASALTAMQAGADWLEGAFAGLGGDLWAPGPPEVLGNAPFEDLVHLAELMGIETGVDLPRYLAVVRRVQELTGWKPQSFIMSGGTRAELSREGILDVCTERETA